MRLSAAAAWCAQWVTGVPGLVNYATNIVLEHTFVGVVNSVAARRVTAMTELTAARVPSPRARAVLRLEPAEVTLLPGTVSKHARTQGVDDAVATQRLRVLLAAAAGHAVPAASTDRGHERPSRRYYVGSLVLVLSEDLSGLLNVHPLRDATDLLRAEASPVRLHVPTLAFTAGVLRRAAAILDLPEPRNGDQPSWDSVSEAVRAQVTDLHGSWGDVVDDASGRQVRRHDGCTWVVTTFAGNRQAARLRTPDEASTKA